MLIAGYVIQRLWVARRLIRAIHLAIFIRLTVIKPLATRAKDLEAGVGFEPTTFGL